MNSLALRTSLESILPASHILTKDIERLAYANDASCYYLVPQAIVQPQTIRQIQDLFAWSRLHGIPLTFRAAGTSLSGQAITDGVLVDISKHWHSINIEHDAHRVRLQPGIVGGKVNEYLKKYKRKIGPDPASLYAAMIGGIIANNASGMCCGTKHNSYHTLRAMIYILPNGVIVNTEIPHYDDTLRVQAPKIYIEIEALRDEIRNDSDLVKLIRKKYSIKNTIGYSLNAFLDYDLPADILRHIMVGSEGTLGFIAEAVLDTVPDKQFKYTGIAYFTDIHSAAQAVPILRDYHAEAVELMDYSCLDAMRHEKGAPEAIQFLPDTACALLIEFQEESKDALIKTKERVDQLIDTLPTIQITPFTTDAKQQAYMWKLRKGTLPIVSAFRPSGTTVITEDIAVPPERLADAVLGLQALMRKHGYEKSYLFGHAKDGNLHFLFAQSFEDTADIERYDGFMRDIAQLIGIDFGGSLKAEHGTGRNMAPFVEMEWGEKAYSLMMRLKQLLDPDNLVNPGVILNTDTMIHTKNLKHIPDVEEVINRCIECGFCEHRCPSKDITLTPRQRIVVRRSMERIKQTDTHRYNALHKEYEYYGLDTCATDGLCEMVCPVNINTGDLVKELRTTALSTTAQSLAHHVSTHFQTAQTLAAFGNTVAQTVESIGIFSLLNPVIRAVKNATGLALPEWNKHITKPADTPPSPATFAHADIVYFPTCIARMMGTPHSGQNKGIPETFCTIAQRAGFAVHIPDAIQSLCCSMPFSSKGYTIAAEDSANATINALWTATRHGVLPVVIDVSSCSYTLSHLEQYLADKELDMYKQLTIMDAVEFIEHHAVPRLHFTKVKEHIALHPVCSIVKMGLSDQFTTLAERCAEHATTPVNAGCCGFAGDRGLLVPELTASATEREAQELYGDSYDGYYASNPACETGMSTATGKEYMSYLFLVEEATRSLHRS